MTPFGAVIVDDEPAARDAVRTFLDEVPEVDVIGEAATGRDAIEVVRAVQPDLLFLDIQMPDQDGFAVLDALGDDMPRGVVLVTAHSEYAQRAFEVHALDYVMKPFGRPRFMAAVERALHRLEADDALSTKETLLSLVRSFQIDRDDASLPAGAEVAAGAGAHPARIGVRIGNRTVLVDVDEIDWIEADGDLVRLHVGERIHLLKSRMRDFEATLPRTKFLRIHRSVIVNLARVKVLHRDRDGSGAVGLDDGVLVRVARGRWEELEGALGLDRKS